MSKSYRKVAEELGVKHLFGRWGISFFPKAPSGIRIYRLFRLIPLDGWITDPDEIMEHFRKNGGEL